MFFRDDAVRVAALSEYVDRQARDRVIQRPPGETLTDAWDGKPAAIMGASVGAIGTVRAQYHLRQIFVFLNVFPVNRPEVMIGNAPQRFDAEGNLTDETAKDYIRQLLRNLAELTRRVRPS